MLEFVGGIIGSVVAFAVIVVLGIVSAVVNSLSIIIGVIFSIPFVGRIIGIVWRSVIEAVWRIVNGVIEIIGFRFQKQLRVCVIIFSTSTGPVATPVEVEPAIQRTKDIFDKEADVRSRPRALR